MLGEAKRCGAWRRPLDPCVSLCVEAGPTYKAFCIAMKFAPPAIDRFGLSFLAESPGLAAQAQRGLTLAFSEKVLRSLEMSHITRALQSLDKFLPQDMVNLDSVPMDGSEALANGWFPQSYIDINCMRVCGVALARAGGEQPTMELKEHATSS